MCNLSCRYCFYLGKEFLYPDTSGFKMPEAVLREYTRQYLAKPGGEVTFTWQGGEPTLLGLDFYEKALSFQEEYNTANKVVRNTLQTNGLKIDDSWAQFFRDHDFLIGLSLDGPEHIHNRYRKYKNGGDSFTQVRRGMDCLQKYDVKFNILGCVSDYSAQFPYKIYDFYRDEAETQYWQFIPIVERHHNRDRDVTEYSVSAEQYGDFLIRIFDRWVRNDIGKISVQIFDVAFRVYLGMNAGLCLFDETCGNALAIEHNGDLYSCDHFVETEHHLGNIGERTLNEMVALPVQNQFGQDKKATLPQYCRNCEVQFICNGGCPKNRFIRTPEGEPGLNYLCAGYKKFFTYIDPHMRYLAEKYKAGNTPEMMMAYIRNHPEQFVVEPKRNALCYCGSGKKYKMCCLQ
ncbi:MAG: anaerobic sulfatase maturase [Candidatus Marinimicrobia bacterium]|nr:anaerobic sulfatase maturase [Candidatus Neomarinimicrobiota bacterium]MCF7880151.1 anaerobic sulfatase maturase [Candidatus Neomarinimicrobiota bacterium]